MSDDVLFDRRARVTVSSMTVPLFDEPYKIETERVNTLIIEDLRIEFEIEHNLTKHPNKCMIKITNLNEASRSVFKLEPLRITLEAGYVNQMATIFTGDVTYAISTLDGPNWVTQLECGDGDRVLAHARVSKSYAAGATVKSILEDVAKSVGQQIPEEIRNHPAVNKIIQGGMALSGKYKDVVEGLLKPSGHSFSIQDGQLQIHTEESVAGEMYLISEGNGMVDSPEFGKPSRKGKPPTITVRSLLYPQIRPGHPVKIISRDLNGVFKVKSVKHRGDTLGSDWVTEAEVTPTQPESKPVPSR